MHSKLPCPLSYPLLKLYTLGQGDSNLCPGYIASRNQHSLDSKYKRRLTVLQSLSDVPETVDLKLSRSEFRQSRWWTRGWTLQELLAPSKFIFFVGGEDVPQEPRMADNRGRPTANTRPAPIRSRPSSPAPVQWRSIGEKTDLSDLIASITGIDIDILVDPELLGNASIAQRMSWASCRVTSRPEDMAYCLMGLFNVQIPMLYGEGAEKAFLRLQEEIMASSDDQSLFAWRDESAAPTARYGLLATTPKFFMNSSRKVPYEDWQCRPPYQMTNRGLQVELPLSELPGQKGLYRAVLDCPVPPECYDHCFLTIFLEKLPGSEVQFARVMADRFGQEWNPGQAQQIYVRQQQHRAATKPPTGLFPRHVFQLRKAAFLKGNYKAVSVIVPDGAEVTDTLATQRGATHWLPETTTTTTNSITTTNTNPHAFRIGKVPWAQCAGAILFERDEDGERLLVRVGSAGRAAVGFDAVRLLPAYRAGAEDAKHLRAQAREAFVPLQSGQSAALKHHRVRVNFAEPQVHGGSKYILVDLEIEAVSFAAAHHHRVPTWDTVTLQGEDTVERGGEAASVVAASERSAPVKGSRWWWPMPTRSRAPKVDLLEPPRPLVVRHVASAGSLRDIARWRGED